jgi:hypothetical protein
MYMKALQKWIESRPIIAVTLLGCGIVVLAVILLIIARVCWQPFSITLSRLSAAETCTVSAQ